MKFIVCDQGANLVRLFKQLDNNNDFCEYEDIDSDYEDELIEETIASTDDVNNEIKIIFKEVDELELKDTNIAISDDELEVQSDNSIASIQSDEDSFEARRNFTINLGKPI